MPPQALVLVLSGDLLFGKMAQAISLKEKANRQKRVTIMEAATKAVEIMTFSFAESGQQKVYCHIHLSKCQVDQEYSIHIYI